ncbi:MAG: CpsD/CapB family tyrosine-protein kinase [Ktedonobacteraceae bacterium]|nr:CpsD/CapB family tyrosine-protein kinase [Ktedonobacteraceae bacterium]
MVENTDTALAQTQKLKMVKKSTKETRKSVKEEAAVAKDEQQPTKEEKTVTEKEKDQVKEEIILVKEKKLTTEEKVTVAEKRQQPVKEEVTVVEEEQLPVKEKVIIAEETRGNKAVTSAAVWKPVPPSRAVAAKNGEIRDPKGGASSKRRLQYQLAEVRMLRTRCGQLGTSLFFHERAAVRSLGFTSAIDGEGKSFLARLAAEAMAEDNNVPVTLLECNWEHPDLENLFGLKRGAGLAEWLRGDCGLEAIRQQVSHNLTVIPAGEDRHDAIRLLQQFRQKGVLNVLAHPDEVLIVDLPSVVMTAYGPLAASLVEALVIVVRAGVTPDSLVAEACANLKDLRVHGIILNQVESRIPRWLRQLL